jgi:hypothetical protein
MEQAFERWSAARNVRSKIGTRVRKNGTGVRAVERSPQRGIELRAGSNATPSDVRIIERGFEKRNTRSKNGTAILSGRSRKRDAELRTGSDGVGFRG